MDKQSKPQSPVWVKVVESFPEPSRGAIGQMAANCIQSLSLIRQLSFALFTEVVEASKFGREDVHNAE